MSGRRTVTKKTTKTVVDETELTICDWCDQPSEDISVAALEPTLVYRTDRGLNSRTKQIHLDIDVWRHAFIPSRDAEVRIQSQGNIYLCPICEGVLFGDDDDDDDVDDDDPEYLTDGGACVKHRCFDCQRIFDGAMNGTDCPHCESGKSVCSYPDTGFCR